MNPSSASAAESNRTEAPFPDGVALQQLIEPQMARHAGRTAVVCEHDDASGANSLTYAQLAARANQLARRLRHAGAGPGKIVALMAERSLAAIVGVLAILKAGAAYLPVAPEHPAERIDYMLRDGGVELVLKQRRSARPAGFRGRLVDLDDAALYRGPSADPAVLNRPDDLAYVIYTSGSTGWPKGVMIEHRSLVNRLHWMQCAYPIGVGDVILQKTPLSFDVSIWELFWWALRGATLCLPAPGAERNPMAIVEAIGRYRVGILHFVPSMLNVFLEYLDGKSAAVVSGLSSVRRVFASGEALTPSHVRKFHHVWGRRTGARLTNLYGPTEATIDVSYFDCPAHGDLAPVPIGRPIHNTRLYVIAAGRQMPIGQPGELCIAGVGLARGYLNNAALTAERFTDNPVRPGERIYRTGDIARRLPDGNLEYLGREDHQVKIRGQRIELGEIENTIRQCPGVADCVAVVDRASETVSAIVAYVVARPELRPDALKEILARRLPHYMIPARFVLRDALPLTASGKADRKALAQCCGAA